MLSIIEIERQIAQNSREIEESRLSSQAFKQKVNNNG